MDRKIYSSLIVILAFALATACLSPMALARDTRVGDILKSPVDYVNTVVRLEGIVDETTPDEPGFPKGVYTLRDEFGDSIKVRTKKLPGIGQHIRVKGTVFIHQEIGEPRIKQEWPWIRSEYVIYAIIVAAAVVVILLVVLIILTALSRRTPTERARVQVTPGAPSEPGKADTTPAPAPTAADTTKLIEPRASIFVVEGPSAGKSFEITKTDISIGRADECDIQLPESDTSVSRRHVSIRHANKQYTIINESATNPMKINGEEIQSKVLQDGDEIQLGTTRLQIRLQSSG